MAAVSICCELKRLLAKLLHHHFSRQNISAEATEFGLISLFLAASRTVDHGTQAGAVIRPQLNLTADD
jgi:hypothetical protein